MYLVAGAKNSKVYISVKAIQYYGGKSKALHTLHLQYALVIYVGKYTCFHLVWLPLYDMWYTLFYWIPLYCILTRLFNVVKKNLDIHSAYAPGSSLVYAAIVV